MQSPFDRRATFHSYPPRATRDLPHDGGLMVVLRGTGILRSEATSRILAPGDTMLLGSGKSTFTASAAGAELLHERVHEALRGAPASSSDSAWPSAAAVHGDRRATEALRHMQAELGRNWTVEDLARSVGASRTTFARIFKATAGESPLKHLTRLRLSRAAELLRHSDLALAEIAEHVGYRSEFAFNRAFKRHLGSAPGLFRRTTRSAPTMRAVAA